MHTLPSPAAHDADLDRLLQAVAARCEPSFERLYKLTYRRLFGIVFMINRDHAEAEDVLQDVYLRVWKQCAQFDAERGRALAWLCRIARHGALDSLRRREARPASQLATTTDPDDPYAGLPCEATPPQEAAMHRQHLSAVRRGLTRLPPMQRQSVSLALYHGLSHAEIAIRLQQPLGTVKTWLRRSSHGLRAAVASPTPQPRSA